MQLTRFCALVTCTSALVTNPTTHVKCSHIRRLNPTACTPALAPPLQSCLRVGFSSTASAATWMLVRSGLNSVAASSAVGLVAGVVLPTPLATASFCGTFAGMSSHIVAPTAANAAIIGGAAGTLLTALDASNTRFLKGYGGRLGATAAFIATASIAANPTLRASGLLYQPAAAAAAAPEALVTTVGSTVVGFAAMRLWTRCIALLLRNPSTSRSSVDGQPRRAALALRLSSPVSSASIVGLVTSTLLGATRPSVVASIFAGTFVAMSAPEKVPGAQRAFIHHTVLFITPFFQSPLACIQHWTCTCAQAGPIARCAVRRSRMCGFCAGATGGGRRGGRWQAWGRCCNWRALCPALCVALRLVQSSAQSSSDDAHTTVTASADLLAERITLTCDCASL